MAPTALRPRRSFPSLAPGSKSDITAGVTPPAAITRDNSPSRVLYLSWRDSHLSRPAHTAQYTTRCGATMLSFQSRPRPGLVPSAKFSGGASVQIAPRIPNAMALPQERSFQGFRLLPRSRPCRRICRPRRWLPALGTWSFHRPLSDLRAELRLRFSAVSAGDPELILLSLQIGLLSPARER